MSKTQKSKKKVTFGLSQKLLLVILPLLVAAFAVTAVVLYSNVSDMLLENSTQAFQIETESKVISVENAILTTSGSKSLQNAVIQFSLIASKLEVVQNFVKDITIMDEGHLFMVDTTAGKITAHPSATYDNTDLDSYSPELLWEILLHRSMQVIRRCLPFQRDIRNIMLSCPSSTRHLMFSLPISIRLRCSQS